MKTCYVDYESRAIADLCDAIDAGFKGWLITRINVPVRQRGKGVGSKLLQQILDDADLEGVNLFLEVVPSGGLDRDQLEDWYTRKGFKHYKGFMVRKPLVTRLSRV